MPDLLVAVFERASQASVRPFVWREYWDTVAASHGAMRLAGGSSNGAGLSS